ncbi:MAG: hypothetical protein ACO1N8_06260 [Methylophilus sp.]
MALKTKTPQAVKADIEKRGVTIKQVAEEIGCDYRVVHAVLSGLSKYRRGEAHKAAVALGIKEAF